MPLYEYQCSQCGRFELIRKFSDDALTACPTCGREITKLASAPAIQFKGTGWYITDYARKSGGGDGGGDGSSKPAGGNGVSTSASTKDGKDGKDSSTPITTTSQDSSAKSSSPTK